MSKKVLIPMDDELFMAIDEYWHTHRLMSRAAAIRELITKSLRAEEVRSEGKEEKKEF